MWRPRARHANDPLIRPFNSTLRFPPTILNRLHTMPSQFKAGGKFTVTSGLVKVALDLYVVNGLFNLYGITLPLRMKVILLPQSHDLIVFSPFSPTSVKLSSLGGVKAVISPTFMHDTCAQAFANAHPDAVLYCSPSLPKKHLDRDWGTVLYDSVPEDIISKHVLVRMLSVFHSL